MAKKLGTIKSISGSAEVIAVDKSGNQRVLKVGDSLYEGETVKTTSADSKVVIATNNGKELSMIGEDTLSLDPKATAADSQVAALQKALLNGANLEDLEETAAGGNSGGRGDGMSLGETRFEHGGHYSNISASTSAINPLGAASFAGPVEGKSGGLDSGRGGSDNDTAGTGTTIDPETTRKPSNPEIKFPEDTNKDGKISDDENKAGDKDTGKTTVEVTIPKDGSVKPGDKVVVTDDNGKKTEKPINQDDIDKGKIDIPVDLNPGKDNNVTAEIINPNNPNNPGKDSKVIGEDSENTKAPEAPVINEIIDDAKGYGEDTKVGNVLDVKGHLTNDKTPTIKGTAKAGSKVEIYDNGDRIGETTAKADGSWEFAAPELTKQGEHKFTATAENKFGKSTPSNEATIDLDSIAPKLDNVKITPIDTNSKADDTAELTMGTGHTDTPNAEILFRDVDNNIIGKGHANSSGDFLIQLDKAVQPGTPVFVQAIDKAGNAGTEMATAGNIEHPNDTKGPKVDIDTVTPVDTNNPSDGTPDKGIVKGKSDEPNAPVVVTDENGKTIGTGTTDDKGNFEITTDPIKPGDKVKVEVTDKAGNKGSDTETAGDTEILHKDLPEAPVINEVIDDAKGYGEDTKVGNVLDVKGHLTNDKTPTIKGTAKAGSKVEIYDNGDRIGETTAKADGSWEFAAPELTKQGEHKFTATAENKFGKSTPSNEATIDLDSIAPKLDNVKITPIDTNSKADDTAELTMGTGHTDTPNAEILFRDVDNNIIGKGHANSSGDFLIQLDKAVQPGTPVFVQAIDKAGNAGTEMATAGNIEHPNDTKGPKVDIDTVTPVDTNNPSDGTPDKGIVKGKSDEPNAPVVVTDENGKTIGTGTTDDKGNFEITTDPIKPGDKVKVEVTDKAGNKGSDTETAGDTEILHKDLPEAPVINEVIDDAKGYGEDTKVGNVLDVKGHLTNDKTPTIKGTAKAGSKVEIYDNGDRIGETTAKADGSWEFAAPELTKQGEHKFTATAENKFGKSTPSNEATIDLDSIAPKLDNVKITPIDTNSKADDTAELTMGTGHTDTPNAEILFRDVDNNIIGKGHANSSGDFLIQLDKAVQPGTPVFVQAIDKAGNAGTEMATAGNIEHPNDTKGPKVDIDTVTPVDTNNPSDGTPDKGIVKGKSDEPNAPVVVTDENGKTIGTGTTDDKGNFEITTDPIKPGDKVKVEVTDKAGNKGSDTETAGDTEILHKDLPEAPVINEIIDDAKGYGEDTKVGNVLDVKGHLTNDKTPTIKGTAKAGSKVEIYDNGDRIGETTAKADGSWEFAAPELTKQGEHKFTATAENKFGKSTPSNEATIDLDSIAPKLDNVKITPIDTNSKADDTAELTMGTGHTDTPNAEILFRDVDNNIIGKGHANSSGDFLIQLDKAVQPGTPVFVQAIDKAGNAGTEMATAGNIEHPNDTKGPKVDIDTVTPVDTNNPSDGTPDKGIVKGKSDEPNAPVVVTDENGKTIGTGTTDDKGNFEITTDPIKPGDKVKVEVTDKAGNKGSGEGTAGDMDFNDNVAPDAPVITEVTDNAYGGIENGGNVLGINDGFTNDNTPTFKGTAEPNTTIVLKNGNDVIGKDIIVKADGSWEFTPKTPLADGEYNVVAIATDKAGNVSVPSNVATINIDTHVTTPVITEIIDDVAGGIVNGDVKNGLTNDNTPTLKGTAEPGSTVKVWIDGLSKGSFVNGEVIYDWTTITKEDGTWEFTTPKLSDGSHTFKVQTTDRAGNNSPESSVVSVNIDTTIGNPKVRFVEDINNDGVLSVAEVAAIKDGKAHWVIDIPTDGSVKAGDVIQSIDGKGNWVKFVEITDEMIKDGRFEATFNVGINKLKDGKYETPEYRFADEAGNVSDSSKASLSLDSEFSRKPSNPEIKFPEDTNKDGKISDDENKAGDKDTGKTTVEVTIPKDGSVKPGDKVVVTDDNGKKTEKPINQDDIDKGKIDIPVDLNPGKDNNVTAEIINPNNPNNPGKDSKVIGEASSTVKVTIDEIIDDVTGGVVNGDVKNGLTNDNLPTFKGSAAPGATVEIYESFYTTTEKTLVGKVTADANGKWSFTPTEAMSDGEHYFEAVATDKVGNKSTSDRVSLDVDTFADAPVIDAVNDNVDNQTGNVLDAKTKVALTNDSTPTLEGYAEPDSVITIYEISELNGEKTAIGTVTADNHGGWKFELPELGDGEYKYTTRAQDKAGNISGFSEVVVVNADLIAPSEPTITFVEDVNPKDGKLNKAENGKDGDSTSTKAQISVPGDAEENDVIHYTVNGEEKTHTITYNDRVTGYVEIKVPVVDGKASSVTAKIVDQAGNASKEVSGSVDVDTTIGNPKVRFVEDINNDGVLSVAEVAAIKDGKAHWVIDIPTDGSVKAGDVIQSIDGKGNWVKFVEITDEMIKDGRFEATFNVGINKLKDGKYETPEYRFADEAGNVSDSSKASLSLDSEFSRKPSNPEIKFPEDTNKDGKISDDENKAGDKDTGKTTVEVTIPKDGSVKPGDKVVVTDDNGKKTEKPINQDDIDKGKIDIPVDLNPGKDNNVTAEIINPNNPNNPGKDSKVIGEASSTVKVTIDEIIDDVTGGVVNGDVKNGLTNDNLPTFKGSAAPGATVEIYESFYTTTEKTLVGKVTADANGKWSFTPTEAMSDGEHYFEAVATDKVGNKSTSDRVSLDVDTFADAPVIDAVNDNVDNQTGNVLDAKTKVALTNDSTPTLEGYAEPDSVITIYEISELNGEKTAIGTVTADNHGGWKFELPELGDGEYKYTTRAQDKAGNISGFSEVVVVNADLIAPSEPTITFVEDVNPKDGKLNKAENGKDGDSTSTKAQISVPGDAEENDVIHYTVNGEEKTHTITYNDRVTGYVEIKVPVVDGKASSVTAKIVDQAGNASKEVSNNLDVDIHIDAPVITAVTDNWWGGVENGGNILGVNDGFTNDTTPTFKGTAEAGSTIVLKNGNDIINKDIIVKADADGNWEFTPKSPLAEGEYNVVAIATDKAGNVSNPSNVATVNVDTSTTQPVITEIIDDVAGGVVGNVKNALTNDNLPTLKGTAEAFSTVKIMVDDKLVFKDGKEVTATADKDGNWEYTFEANLNWGGKVHAALEDGVHTLKVQTTDRAGNRSAVSEWSSVDVDTTIGAPTVKITTDINSDKKIDIADASALKDGKLKWVIDIPENTVKAGDRVQILGSDATWTDIFKVTAQDIAKGFIERDEFSIDMPKSRGFQTPSYRLVDDAGNVSEGNMDAVKIVGFAPKAPTIIAVLDNEYGIDPKNPTDTNAGDTTGNVLEGTIAITNDKTPTLIGKAEAGTTITLKNGDTVIAEKIPVDANGNWHYEPEENSPWADGDYKITAIAKNIFGKESESSSPITVTVDTTVPEVTLTSIEDSVKTNDVVDFTGNVKGKVTNDNTPLLKGTAEAGSVIIIKYGEHHENVVTTKADKNGHWDYKITNPLSDGEHIISYQAVDKAGNTSLEYVANVTVDTKIADAKVEFIEDTNNDGKFSWKENIENPNIGRMAWKALIPDDGSIKAGDTFNYRWGASDSWHNRTITQADIDRGYIGEKVQNQYEQGQPNAGKPLAFGANANGRVYEAEAYFSDAAGNKGAKGSDKVVFDFSDSESGAKTVNVKITSIDDNVPGWNSKTGNIITNEAAHIAGLTNDNTPTISGTTEAGAIVKVSIVNSKTHKVWESDVKANENGEWSITTGNIADGKYSVVAVATDKSGVASSPYTVSGLEIDTTVAKPNIWVAEDRNHDGFYDNAEYHNPANGKGDITFVVEVPKDGSVKVGDTFHYTLNTDYKGWSSINGYGENITISQADIDNGSFSRVVTLCKDNQHFDLRHDGATVSMKGQFKDLAGNALADETSVKFDLTKAHSGKVRSTRSLPDDILDNDSVDLSNAARINEPKAELNVLNNNKIGVSANDLLETPKDHIMNEGKSEAKPSYATASSHAGEENIATTHPIQIEEKVESHF